MFFKIYIQFSFIVLAYIKYEKTRTEHARIQIYGRCFILLDFKQEPLK